MKKTIFYALLLTILIPNIYFLSESIILPEKPTPTCDQSPHQN